jgi:TolB-like protein
MTRAIGAALALVLLAPAAAGAAVSQTVAVMPFKDLSGAKSSVGEAIRETVTADLKDVPGVRVLERGAIDKILAEQNLQANKADLDASSTVKLGKLLGASLVVVGGFQRSGSQVRLTARFVKVETGEIVGTAKVDGASSDLFKLQDRVTVELLKSAGIAAPSVEKFAKRERPKVKSFKAIELYGDAVVEKDEHKKVEILKLALNEDPSFSYAAHDLDALEKRIRSYVAAADAAQNAANRELAEKLAREKDPNKVWQDTFQLGTNLFIQRRYRKALLVFRSLQTLKAPAGWEMQADSVSTQVIKCYELLKQDDGVLREGERFLKERPTSMLFSVVQVEMNAAMERKRQADEGGHDSAEEIGKLDAADRKNPCRTGTIYQSHHQYAKARRELEACVRAGEDKVNPGVATLNLVMATWELGDFAAAKHWLDELRQKYPNWYRNLRQFEAMMPLDD